MQFYKFRIVHLLFINPIQTIYLGYNVEISVTFSLKIHSQIPQSFYLRALYVVRTVLDVRHINGNVSLLLDLSY